jgi:hypothetical protein
MSNKSTQDKRSSHGHNVHCGPCHRHQHLCGGEGGVREGQIGSKKERTRMGHGHDLQCSCHTHPSAPLGGAKGRRVLGLGWSGVGEGEGMALG